MKLINYTISVLILLILGCDWIKPTNKYVLKQEKESFSIGLKKPMSGYFHPAIILFDNNDTSFIYYFSKADTTLRIFPVKDTGVKQFISLSTLFNERIHYSNKEGAFSYMESKDLLWIDSPRSDSIYQVDLSNLSIIKAVSKRLENKEILLTDFIQPYINSAENKLLLGIYMETNGAYGLFEIEENMFLLKKELDVYSSDYKRKDMYISSGSLTQVSSDSIIVSYYYSDTVSLFVKNNFVKQICLKSDSALEFTGFKGNRQDINAISSYFSMKQRYNTLLYDEKNKLYYRIFLFEQENNGRIELSKKWSVCVFDASFNKIHEEFFNNDEYFIGYVFLIDSDLYLTNSKESVFNRDSSTVVLNKFTLKRINP